MGCGPAGGSTRIGKADRLAFGPSGEVWLRGGIRLRGKLCLKEETLSIEEEKVRILTLWSITSHLFTAKWTLVCGWISF